MKRLFGTAAVAGTLALVVAGCATIATGTSQTISISSNVDGAAIYLDGERVGTTPFNGTVPKGKSNLRVEAPGYRDQTLSLSRQLEPAFWGNIIIGGTLGSITDFASGAAYQYAPASYQVELRSVAQSDAEFYQQNAVRKFAMIYIDPISQDIAAGQGDHVSALLQLINSTEDKGVDAEAIRAALEKSRGYAIAFGQSVVDLL
jgi:hypothetical protein